MLFLRNGEYIYTEDEPINDCSKMKDKDVFNRLVLELTPVERKELLSKIGPVEVFQEPMIDFSRGEEVDLEKEFYSMGFLERIIIFFRSIISGEDKLQLTEEIILKKIEREIKSECGGIISYKNGQLLPPFREELLKLAESVRYFDSWLKNSYFTNREDFIIFLGSLQMPEIHQQLSVAVSFEEAEKRTGLSNLSDIKREVSISLESTLDLVSGDLRKTMYLHAQTLHLLGELVLYDFESLIGQFRERSKNGETNCFFGAARNLLEKLTNILTSFRMSPDAIVLEAIFLFANQNLRATDEETFQNDLKKFLNNSKRNLEAVKKFNKRTMPVKLMKLITENIGYQPVKVSGGEDWYNIYTRYWNNLADIAFRKYSAEKRKLRIYEELRRFNKSDKLPELDNYKYTYQYSTGFLNEFIREQFSSIMNEILKKILVDGRFYKKQNKDDFTDSYSRLLGLYEKLNKFDQKMSPQGEIGSQLAAIEQEMAGTSVRRKKEASFIEAADMEAREIIRTGIEAMAMLKLILYGILHGRAGGQYDSLSNINRLVTVESRDFIIDLNNVYTKLEDSCRILGDIMDLEEESR